MIKELNTNINNYVLLDILHMLDYLEYDDIIEDELKKFRRLVNKQVFGDFFKNLDDIEIINQEFKIKYTFEKIS